MSAEQIIECISKPPSQRGDAELSGIIDWFLTKLSEDARPSVEAAKDILRNCEFREVPRDYVVIRQGDIGDCFYICLTGKVSVFINTEAVPDDPTEAQVVVEDSVATAGEKKELDRSKYGKYIVRFGAGKGFGELALISKDCVRNASIISDETTQLIVVNKGLYNRSLKAVQEAKFKERIDFVNKCPVFNNWLARYKRQAAMSLRKESYNFEETIVKQGEGLNGLYFLISGQAKVVVDIIQHYNQYPLLHLHESPEDLHQKEIMGKLMEQNLDEKQQPRRQQLWEKPIRRLGYAAAEHRQSQRHMEISLIGPGEMIGDIEHGMDLSTYAQSVICIQNTDVFILDAKNFERLVLNKRNMAQTLDILAQKAETKLMSRVTRALDKQVPLIRNLCHRIVEAHKTEERRRQKADKEHDFDVKDSDMSHFIPSRGSLIDPFGPGTVFYRNKMKRERKLAAQKAKEAKAGGGRLGGGANANSTAAAMFTVDDSDDSVAAHDGTGAEAAADQRQQQDDAYDAARRVLDDFEDFDTSSEHLADLERRISVWFDNVDQTKRGAKVVQMTRFHKEEDRKIHPGKKVYMRPKKQPRRVTLGNEPEDWGYKSEEEIFITAQAEMRSRLSLRGTTAYAQHVGFLDDEEPRAMEAPEEERQRANLHRGGVQRAEGAAAKAGDAAGDVPQLAQDLAAPQAGQTQHSSRPTSRHSPRPKQQQQKQQQQQQQDFLPPINPVTKAGTISRAVAPDQRGAGAEGRSDPVGFSVHEQLSAAEKRESTAAILRDILSHQILPEEVKETLRELERMNTVLPELDCAAGQQQNAVRRRSHTFRARTILLPSRIMRDSTVCLRCRRHHLAASTTL